MDEKKNKVTERKIDREIKSGLGDDLPIPLPLNRKSSAGGKVEVNDYLDKVRAALSSCVSKREVLDKKVESLAECVGIAAEIYKQAPIPDNAYQLSALTNSHNSALSQLERMKDPEVIQSEIHNLIKEMFNTVVQGWTLEIDKARRDLSEKYPEDKTTIRDQFSRMLVAIQPETQRIYDDFDNALCKILGLKKIKK